MKLFSMFLVALLAAGIEMPAFAQEGVEEEADAAGGVWSVGAGVGFPIYGGLIGGAIGGMAGYFYNVSIPSASSPIGKLMVERRLGDSWALMFELDGSYADNGKGDTASPNSALSLSANLGARWIINPGGVVEISPSISLGGGIQKMNGLRSVYGIGGSDSTSDLYSYVVGLGVGLVLERKLMDNFFLRLESLVAEVTYQYGEIVPNSDDVGAKITANRFLADLSFTPSIQLRLVF